MPDKDEENWAGKGFSKRNSESAPEPKPKLQVVPKPEPKKDPEDWIWE